MKRIVFILAVGAAALLVLVTLVFQTVPYIANTYIIPSFLQNSRTSDAVLNIQHFSPWRLAGNIELGKGLNQSLSLPRIEVDYTPTTLIHGRLTNLLIDGANIKLQLTDGKLVLRGFPPSPLGSKASGFSLLQLPLSVDRLHLHNCSILVERKNHPPVVMTINGIFHLGFISLPGKHFELESADGELQTSGMLTTTLHLKLNDDKGVNHLHLTAAISRMADISVLLPGNQAISGQGKLTVAAVMARNFDSINQLTANLEFPNLIWESGPIRLESKKSQPLQLNLNGSDKQLHYQMTHFYISGPHGIEASMQGDIYPTKHVITGSGNLLVKNIKKPMQLFLKGAIHNRKTDLELQLQGDGQELAVEESPIRLGPFRFTTRLQHDPQTTTIEQQVNLKTVMLPKQQLQFRNIQGRLNLQPEGFTGKAPPPGHLAIQEIRYQGQDIAGLTATLAQNAMGLSFNGRISSRLGAKPDLLFHGTASKDQPLSMTYKLPTVQINQNSLPASLLLPADAALSGKIGAEGSMEITNSSIKGQLIMSLKDGSFELPEKKIHIIGINCDITLPQLPEPISSPSQLLTIDTMDLNTLKFTNGKIFFRLENASTLFLEKSLFDWCHGKVETGSMRLSSSEKKLSTTFYCDRLQFSELLNQFGIPGTEGKGSLNGRLPVTLSRKGLIFDDGFLFSTPGNNGIVRFNNTDMLRQGITGGSKAAVLDYSIQAMQNFAYNWTRLTFNSQNGDLLISMQIDGKPASPLPYGYHEGQLVARKNGPGLQRPIRLDVNFHLPFAKIFRYGQGLQKLMEKIQ